jgi:hypothetical protein
MINSVSKIHFYDWPNNSMNSDWEKLHSEAAQLFPVGYAERYLRLN